MNITTDEVVRYQKDRLDNDATNASVNREMAALKRMFNLGAQQSPPKVASVPYIPMLKENNTRTGFFEQKDFDALKENLPEYLKGFCTFAYRTGVRFEELASMKWDQLDTRNKIIRLEDSMVKNEDGRIIPLDDELWEIVQEQLALYNRCDMDVDYIFPNWNRTDRIRQIRRA